MEKMLSAELAQLDTREAHPAGDGDATEDGVLLYYKFAHIHDPEETKNWLFNLCSSLRLSGRIRVAPDGINITVGGKIAALQEHIKVVSSNPLFEGTDFKLASCSPPVNPKAAAECGCTSLSARTVKELVTLGLHRSVQPPSVSNAGRRATAQEFHKILQAREQDQASFKGTVVVDARNVYETRIGKFSVPKGAEIFDPMVRQYSDLPRWIDENEDQLRNKQILMYCTGGVRCEMASAYIRSKGKEFEDVVQLSGGIQRYVEAFPDGGYFLGKNFVFDHRLAVPSSNALVVGRCLKCDTPYDDYSARCRCSLCRMLVLVCSDCQAAAGELTGAHYICEVCTKTGKRLNPNKQVGPQGFLDCEGYTENRELSAAVSDNQGSKQRDDRLIASENLKDQSQQRKLRILCLHGFRQNGSKLKGRLNALRKKLRRKVELFYVDAPHEVPSVGELHHSEHQLGSYSESQRGGNCSGLGSDAGVVPSSAKTTITTRVSKKFAWLLSPDTTFGDPPISSKAPKAVNHRETRADMQFETDAPCVSSLEQCSPERHVQYSGVGQKELSSGNSVSGESRETCLSQHLTQSLGWSRSWEYLQTVFAEQGPFDGVLGFSQGAAIAAALCFSRMSGSGPVQFRFVILCSGFISPAAEHSETLFSLNEGAIDIPSLHIFGGCEGTDRQINVRESEQLAALFRPEKRVTVRHQSGHIIPTQPEYVDQYLRFLDEFE